MADNWPGLDVGGDYGNEDPFGNYPVPTDGGHYPDMDPGVPGGIPGNDSMMTTNCTEMLKFFEAMKTYYAPSQIVIPVVYCLICVIGLIGNGLVMFVIFGSKEMTKTVANIYIWNLAVADTLFLVTLPFSSTQRFLLEWPFGAGMCKIVEAVKYLNYYSSIFFLTAMSIDRYIAVQYVVTSSRWRTSRNTFFVCAAIWVVSLVMVTPLLIYSRLDGGVCALMFHTEDPEFKDDLTLEESRALLPTAYDYDCERFEEIMRLSNMPETSGEMPFDYPDYSAMEQQGDKSTTVMCKHNTSKTFHTFLIFSTVVGFVIPFAIISVCYIMIVVRMLQPSETRSRSRQAERTRRKVTRMVVALVITFFICWLPFYMWHLMQIKGVRARQGVCHNIRDFTFCLAFANSCLNPILYTFLGHNFQERLRKSIAISFRSFSLHTTRYTTNTVSRGETPAHSKKQEASHSEQGDLSMKVTQPLCQPKNGERKPATTEKLL